MRAYFASTISPNMAETPEGYLLCRNVPISRTGVYEYLGSEIGLDHNELVKVIRSAEEVFSPSAISSFEGKPITDNHPPEALNSENVTQYDKGPVSNVRQGKGSDSDLLLADLLIQDQRLIDAIRAGKREVSAGYECDYVPNGDGTYSQVAIIGNHVAVVDQGRAGHRVRINDARGKGVNDSVRVRDDSKLDQEAEKAAKKYGIAVKKDGHRTPPEGYPSDREQYADPVNYKYPLDTKEHVQAAVDYFQKKKDHSEGDYSDAEWAKMGKRITDAANRVLHKGYEYKDGNIVDTRRTDDETPEQETSVAHWVRSTDKKTKARDSGMNLKIPSRTAQSVRRAFQAMGFKQFAMDAEPDEIMDAWDAMTDEEKAEAERAAKEGEKKEDGAKETHDDEADQKKLDQVLEALKGLGERIDKLEKGKANDEKSAEETLDEELKKLDSDHEDEEESQTVEPEELSEDGVVLPPDERPKNPITGDSAAKRAALMAIKPILASIPDEKTRKQVVDTAIASFKGRSGNNTYATMARDTKNRVQKQQQKQAETIDHSDLGEKIAKQWNPHYREHNA